MGERLYHEADFARLYDLDCEWGDDFHLFARLADGFGRVLDLGCGTGIVTTHLAGIGHQMTGVDPAGAMLEIARGRPGGNAVRWVQANAQGLDLGEGFDLVLMTGHAFQTLLTRADRMEVMRTMARHLVPGGRFYFDSRNPVARGWERWTPALTYRVLEHPTDGPIERWNEARMAAGLVTYDTEYRFADGRALSAQSQIAFAAQVEIAEVIAEAGLVVDRWLGTYQEAAFQADSPEIIAVGHLP